MQQLPPAKDILSEVVDRLCESIAWSPPNTAWRATALPSIPGIGLASQPDCWFPRDFRISCTAAACVRPINPARSIWTICSRTVSAPKASPATEMTRMRMGTSEKSV